MSNALAIASVTAVLKDLLDNALIDNSISAGVGGPVTITAVAPDRVKTGDREKAQLNLFLYHVEPNAALRNIGFPSRDQSGERLTNPPLALELYYMLSAYGKQDFEAEILLGYAMQMLHETPVLTRDAIRNALSGTTPPVDPTGLPPALQALIASDLADQFEQIKLIPHLMTIEEVSKLWSAFQASYRPSVAYCVSVVLMEAQHPARSALPVLTRGEPIPSIGRDAGVIAQADILPPFPTLQEAELPNNQPSIRMGETLILRGHHLDATQAVARFTHARSGDALEISASSDETAIQVQIPTDPAPGGTTANSPQHPDNWRVGIYSVAGIIQQTGEPVRETNELSIALAPLIKSINATSAGGEVTLVVECSPKVWETQRVTIVIGDRELAVEPIATDKADTLTFKAKSEVLTAGSQWVRLRVDGVESILVNRSGALPVFDPSQGVTIP